MKYNKNNDLILSNNTDIKSYKFKIGDISIITELLTKLYANPIQTLVQEYISNARDAHREIKTNDKIKIIAPTIFNPNISIRDFGKGLSPQRIKTIFTSYGMSTKRKTNEQTGGFGIGAKSAWSYTDSFMVISFYNGIKRVYRCDKTAKNGNMNLISQENTTEKNGTEIKIAISPKDVNQFQNAIIRCIEYWENEEKPIVTNLNIKEIELKKISDKIYLTKNYTGNYSWNKKYNHLMIVDGIPYPVSENIEDQSLWKKLKELFSIGTVIKFNTGEVEIAPTREMLKDSKENIKKINNVLKIELEKINKIIKGELKKGKTFSDKIKIMSELITKYKIPNKIDDFFIENGKIFSEKLFGAKSYRQKKNWKILNYSLEFDDKFKKSNVNNIPINSLQDFLYLDINEGPVKTCRRYRKYLKDNNKNEVYVTTDKNIADKLDLKKVSNLPLPIKKVIKRNSKKQLGKIYGKFYSNSCSWSKVWRNLSELTGEYYYFTQEKYCNFAKYSNKNCVLVSETHAKTLKSVKNFKPIEELFNNWEIDQKDINGYLFDKIKNKYKMSQLFKYSGKFNDKKLIKALKYWNLLKHEKTDNLPYLLKDKMLKNPKYIKGIDFWEKFHKHWNKNYKLLEIISINENKEYLNEIIGYINKQGENKND